ncbi:MAG: hypothetical protein M3396_02695 [Actinomycetota bacterium]|nr:hypothetical protein [Actinomycetota bacterium]MDQ3573774.1 hypothetical protein [Actinomycetota bacterium]
MGHGRDQIAVTTEELQAVGRRVEGVGERMVGFRGALGSLPHTGEPPATSAALADLKAEWVAGLERLADDVRSLGQLTVAVAQIYDRVDGDQFAPVDP